MMRGSLKRVAAVATGVFLLWGGSNVRAAEAAAAALPPFPAGEPAYMLDQATLGVTTYASGADRPAPLIGVDVGQTVATNATDGVATIPLPPSAYPGMVGLATAALSVWRYQRRRR